MDDYTKKLMLLNAIKVAYEDGMLAQSEEAALEELRKEIKSTKTLFKQAMTEVDLYEIDLLRLPRFSERIRSLESMCEVALADGEIEQRELAMIQSSAHASGIHSEQVGRIVDESIFRAEILVRKCKSCGASIDTAAKFCQSCGAKSDEIRTDAAVQVDLSIPSKGVTIAFAESSAAGFASALGVAKKSDSYQVAKRGKVNWHAVTFSQSATKNLIRIADPISTIRNKQVFIDGQESAWREVMSFVRCASERESAYNGVQYCFGLSDNHRMNIWGCKCLNMDWAGWSDWFTYGEFIKKDVFQFDMERIRHELEVQLKTVALCPHIRIQYCAEVLKQLPRKVKVSVDGPWEYRQSYDDSDPRGIEVVVVHDYGDGYKTKEKIVAIGVQPKDPKLPIKIILSAAKAAGERNLSRASLGI